MIKGFEPMRPLDPATANRLQLGPAAGSGLIAGAVLLIIPRGSPWSSLTFAAPAVMGRLLPPGWGMPLPVVWLVHLLVSVLFGLVIARVVASLTQAKAVLTGGLVGLVLYGLNCALVSLVWPELKGGEVAVIFTHAVFGLLAAGAYRGLLRRKAL